MGFLSGGFWHPPSHRGEHDEENADNRDINAPAVIGTAPFVDPYYNVELMRASAVAPTPENMWEIIKGIGGRYMNANYEQVPIPFASFGMRGRGEMMPVLQHPASVSHNVMHMSMIDRYGPYRRPVPAQQQLEAYLASTVPGGVAYLEAKTAR